jgi:serine/threonine protein kinase
MAEIFLARGAGIAGVERYCVLKRVLRDRARDAQFVQMFVEEARLAAQLQHPNIASVYDIGMLGDSYFFTMEYVHGETLRAIFQRAATRGSPVPLGCVLTIIAGAAAGLHHAHERHSTDGRPLGIVHRDVSPSNLMVSYEGNLKLVDFGVAKAADRAVETRSGTVKGKISYLSPEQCAGARVDRRSDLFSLGIVMWELLTGVRLYRRKSDFENMEAIVHEPPPPPSSQQPGIPPEVDDIVLRLLAKSVTDRFQTAAEVVEATENASASAKTILSTVAVSRLIRELFGFRAEPWLTLDCDSPSNDPVTVQRRPIPDQVELGLTDPVEIELAAVLDLTTSSMRVDGSIADAPERADAAELSDPPATPGTTALAHPPVDHRAVRSVVPGGVVEPRGGDAQHSDDVAAMIHAQLSLPSAVSAQPFVLPHALPIGIADPGSRSVTAPTVTSSITTASLDTTSAPAAVPMTPAIRSLVTTLLTSNPPPPVPFSAPEAFIAPNVAPITDVSVPSRPVGSPNPAGPPNIAVQGHAHPAPQPVPIVAWPQAHSLSVSSVPARRHPAGRPSVLSWRLAVVTAIAAAVGVGGAWLSTRDSEAEPRGTATTTAVTVAGAAIRETAEPPHTMAKVTEAASEILDASTGPRPDPEIDMTAETSAASTEPPKAVASQSTAAQSQIPATPIPASVSTAPPAVKTLLSTKKPGPLPAGTAMATPPPPPPKSPLTVPGSPPSPPTKPALTPVPSARIAQQASTAQPTPASVLTYRMLTALYQQQDFAGVVTACSNANAALTAEIARICVLGACHQRDLAQAARWLLSSSPAQREGIVANCKQLGNIDIAPRALDCSNNPLDCR